MANESAVLLVSTRHEPGNIDKCDDRDVERIAETYKSGCLVRSIDVEHSSHLSRLIGNNPDALAVEPRKPNNYVWGEVVVDW